MDVTLPPDLERFATEAVAAGRYRDVGEVLAAGVGLLKQSQAEIGAFVQSLEDARDEAEREGWLSAEDVHTDMAALIEEARPVKA